MEQGKIKSSLTLCLLQNSNVLSVLVWKAFHERIHVETVKQPSLLLLAICRYKILLICVEQAGKASHECRTDLVWMESCFAHQTDLRSTTIVDGQFACRAFVHSFIRSFITNATHYLFIHWLGLEKVSFNPTGAFCIIDRVHSSLRNDGGGGNSGLSVHRRGISGSLTIIRVQGGY